jgi:hypothetical protein
MDFSGPEPLRGWAGVATTSRRSSMSNFAAMSFPALEILKCSIYSTCTIIDGFSNSDYVFLEVSVRFRIYHPDRELAHRAKCGYRKAVEGVQQNFAVHREIDEAIPALTFHQPRGHYPLAFPW